jgi:hypothetical protein
VRSRSAGGITIPRAVPSAIFSSESLKSAMVPVLAAAGGQQGGLVDQVGQVRADHGGSGGGQGVQVDVGGQRHGAGVHGQDLAPPALVRRGDRDPPVEPAGARQRRVQHVGPVGGGQHDDALVVSAGDIGADRLRMRYSQYCYI